jgi:hypothetical protein
LEVAADVRTAQVLVVSAIAHAPLLLYLADALAPRPRPHRPAMSLAASPQSAPIEVAFLDEEPTAMAPQPAGQATRQEATSRARRHDRARATATQSVASAALGSAKTDLGGPGDVAIRSSGSGYLRMRGADLALAPATAERIAAAGEQPDELRRSGRLEPAPGGGAVVHDRVTTMTVDPDGKVRFDDKKDIDLKLKMPIPKVWEVENLRRDLGHELTEWFKDPEAGTRFRPTADLPRHLQASQYACDQWSATFCDDPLAPQIEKRVRERKKVNGGFFGGPMDITAWLHRKYVGDPYLSRKLKLLDDTRDERVAMGQAHREQQQARSAEFMRRNLERLWSSETDPVARRAALFELWDDCGDDEAGVRARAVVIGWIRTHLPAGSPSAYTGDELNVLQTRRTSSATFAPYRD